jgi:hypothetical protein
MMLAMIRLDLPAVFMAIRPGCFRADVTIQDVYGGSAPRDRPHEPRI